MTTHYLQTLKVSSDTLNHYALIAEMPIRSFAGHFGNLYAGFYLRVRQYTLSGSNGVERCFNYSVRIEDKNTVFIYCTDRLATEDVTNNVVAVYDESTETIKFYVKPMMVNAYIHLILLDESPAQRLKIYNQPLFYNDITPSFTCKKWKSHPIGYFKGTRAITSGQTYGMDTGFLASSKYDVKLFEADVLMRSGTGKVYKTKQFITTSYESWEENPSIQSVSTIYADETNETGTTLTWVVLNGKLTLSINAVTEHTDVRVLVMEKFI